MRQDDVLAEVERLGAPLVEITGGEPLEQEGFYPLASALCDRGYTVLVETGGHVPLGRVDPRVIKIVDVKCPGSGMESRNDLEQPEAPRPAGRGEVRRRGPGGFLLGGGIRRGSTRSTRSTRS